MSFQRNNNIIQINTSIDAFGDSLSRIANATVNVDASLTNAATLLNIPSRTLSKMLLSIDPNQIQCVTLIRNLSESLKEYHNGVLPEQLSQYIIQLNQHMQDNIVSEDDVPSFFELICPTVRHQHIVNYLPFTNSNVINDNDDDNDDSDDDEQINIEDDDDDKKMNNEDDITVLNHVSEQNIKEDLCVICFLNLNQGPDVVQTICDHQYHNNCINQWIQVKRSCPLCNGNL